MELLISVYESCEPRVNIRNSLFIERIVLDLIACRSYQLLAIALRELRLARYAYDVRRLDNSGRSSCGLAYGFLGLDPRWGGSSYADAAAKVEQAHRTALARARARGAEVTEIVAIDDDHLSAREQLIGDSDVPWLRPLIGSVGGLGIGLDLRTDGLELTLLANLDPKGKVAQLLEPQVVSSALVSSITEQPGFWFQLAIRPPMVLAIAALFGTKPAALSKTLGVDVERELLPLLTGELAVAVTVRDRDLASLTKKDNVEVVVLLGIRDSKAATGLLAKLGKAEALSSLVGGGETGRVVVTLPGLRPLHTRTQGKVLVLSTDPDWPLSTSAQRPPRWLATSRAARLIAKPGSSVAGMVDLGLMFRTLLAWNAVHVPVTMKPYRDPDVPVSPDYEQKRKELDRIDAQIAVQARRAIRRGLRPQLELARSVGNLGLRVDQTDDSLVLRARYATVGRPLVSLVAALVREQLAGHSRAVAREDELSELIERRDGMFIQLVDIHERERAEHEAAPEGEPAKPD